MIVITQEQKQEWETKIAELESIFKANDGTMKQSALVAYSSEYKIYKDLLSKAIVLPVEESWEDFDSVSLSYDRYSEYPNGVIIKQQ